MSQKFKMPSLAELREQGFKVRVTVERVLDLSSDDGRKEALMPMREIREKKLQPCILARGGRVTVEITKDGENFKGVSECSPEDAFVRKTGNAIAFGKCWKEFCKPLAEARRGNRMKHLGREYAPPAVKLRE